MSRRNFLRISGMTGTALWLGFYFPASAREATMLNAAEAEATEIEMNAWVRIDTTGKVTILSHRAEMGQGAYQAIPQIVAEELEVNLNEINIIFAPGDNKKYGSQITGGSSTVRGSYKSLLTLSATAREMLIAAGAAKWNVSKNECYAEGGHIIHKPTGKKLHYGEVVEEASKLELPKEPRLKDPKDFKILGKSIRRPDVPLKTNGKAEFGIDVQVPGMLYASVERCPVIGGTLERFDATEAMKIPGVEKPQLANLKAHLYKELLASLRLLKSSDSIDLQLHEQLDHARILYNKGLYLQSLRILEKVKDLAKSYHQESFLIQVISLEKKIETLHITRSGEGAADRLSPPQNHAHRRQNRCAPGLFAV